MSQKSQKDLMVDAINEILASVVDESKTLTLAKQRGYLTGWLARLASEDWIIKQEIQNRLEISRRSKK